MFSVFEAISYRLIIINWLTKIYCYFSFKGHAATVLPSI